VLLISCVVCHCLRPKIAKLQNSRKKLLLEVLEDDDQVPAAARVMYIVNGASMSVCLSVCLSVSTELPAVNKQALNSTCIVHMFGCHINCLQTMWL